MKYLLKNREEYSKSSDLAEVLKDVTFTVSERVTSINNRFIVAVQTDSDEDSRVRHHFAQRFVEEKKLNSDFLTLIDMYEKSINLNKAGMPIQLKYEPYPSEQFAIIGAFDSKIEAINYIEGLWNFILSMF